MSLKNKLTIFICLLLILFLSGCQVRKSYEIKFIDKEKFEYTSDFKPSDLLVSVNGFKREEFRFNDDYTVLTLPDNSTVKINTSKKEIKLGTIKFEFLYKNQIYSKKIILQDTTPPEIVSENSYDVEIKNKYFDLKNQIYCKDNYTKKNSIKVFFNGSYDLEKEGQYKVEVIAYDQKKNKTVKEIIVNVVNSKVDNDYSQNVNESDVSTKQSESNKSNSSSSNSNNTDNTNNTNNSNHEKPKSDTNNSSFLPETKSFRIENYGTFDACLNACQQYINECLSKGYKGLAKAQPIQENGIYVGYQAIFN